MEDRLVVGLPVDLLVVGILVDLLVVGIRVDLLVPLEQQLVPARER